MDCFRLGLAARCFSAFSLAVALSGCNGRWTNWFQTESVVPEVLVSPKSARELLDQFTKAAAEGKRVRMTGNGHSLSDVAINTDVLMTPEGLSRPLSVDCKRLRAVCDPALVRVEGGIKIADLNTYLDEHGRALFNMGGYDGQTFAGVMMTSTHGSGLAYGPLTDEVVSLQMVADRGQMVQIEPHDGITDPAKWAGYLEEDPSIPVQLVQDDEAFNAARVSIGSMGIVYSVTLRADQKFWLREVRHLISWSELKKPGGALDRAMHGLPIYGEAKASPEHWELQYSPYLNADGDHTFLITDRYRSYQPLPEQSPAERGQLLTDFVSNLVTLVGNPLAEVIDTFPELSKAFLEQALRAEVDGSYTNVSYKVFNIGAVNNTPVLGIESAFDIRDTVAAIERSFSISDALLARGIPITSPIAIRLVKKTDALIGMQNGRNTSFMEIIVLREGRNAKSLLQIHQKTYLSEFGARPHWGLDLNTLTGEAQARASYPDTWDRWKAQFLRFNASGTLDGKVTDRLGISVHPRPATSQERALASVTVFPPETATVPTIPPLTLEELLLKREQRKAALPLFLKAIDEQIVHLEQLGRQLGQLEELRSRVLRRNADIRF